jgi:hypothetical protein
MTGLQSIVNDTVNDLVSETLTDLIEEFKVMFELETRVMNEELRIIGSKTLDHIPDNLSANLIVTTEYTDSGANIHMELDPGIIVGMSDEMIDFINTYIIENTTRRISR